MGTSIESFAYFQGGHQNQKVIIQSNLLYVKCHSTFH